MTPILCILVWLIIGAICVRVYSSRLDPDRFKGMGIPRRELYEENEKAFIFVLFWFWLYVGIGYVFAYLPVLFTKTSDEESQ